MPLEALNRLIAAGEGLRRGRSVTVRGAQGRVDDKAARAALALLGPDGATARALEAAALQEASSFTSLSSLSAPLAVDYLERLERPIPALSPSSGVLIVSRGYAARVAVERDPARFGAPTDLPGLGLPPLRNGHAPQGLPTRVVKATRRGFAGVRAVPEPVWEGFVVLVTARVHDLTPSVPDEELLAVDVVDGLARFGWALRLVDANYGLEPERRPT